MLKRYAALFLIVSINAVPTIAQTVRGNAVHQSDQSDVKIAILFGAASTKEAVDEANEKLRKLYAELDTRTRALTTALRRGDLAERERSRLEGELRVERGKQEDLIAQLAAKDSEYAASIRAYREGLSELLADNDPAIVAAFNRYAEGDASALDDLQDITRIIRKSREAGLRARNGADQRAIALTFLDAKDKGLKTTMQALAPWQEATRVDPTFFVQWIHISRLHRELGNFSDARFAANEAKKVAYSDRDRSLALDEVGDVAVLEGRLDDARAAYKDGLSLSRQLAAANPSRAAAWRDVGVSLNKVGTVAMRLRQFDDARKAFNEELNLFKNLSSNKLNCLTVWRDISVVRDKIGDLAIQEQRRDDAFKSYSEALKISEKRFECYPNSMQASRDLTTSYNKMGDVTTILQRFDDAKIHYEKALKLADTAFKRNPSDLNILRDLIVTLNNNGDISFEQTRLDDAQRFYESALTHARSAVVFNGAEARRDLVGCYFRLARLPGGEAHFGKALELAEAMVRDGAWAPADSELLSILRDKAITPDVSK